MSQIPLRPGSSEPAAILPREGLDVQALRALQAHTSLLHGAAPSPSGPEELLVLCTVRNGELYLRSFMEHYLDLGVAHVVFLDNGSTDRTVELCRRYPRVTVLQTHLPYKRYFHAMSQFLLERFGRSRWCLVVDIDELFDFPYAGILGLKGLLRYLSAHSYNALCAHMVDMFRDEPLCDIQSCPEDSIKDKYPCCDLSALEAYPRRPTIGPNPPEQGNVISNPNIPIWRGGIRKIAFGLSSVTLTKHPLVFYEPPLVLSTPHFVSHAHIADLSCALWHYKFLGSFIAYTQESVERENHWHDSLEYKYYARALQRHPRLNLMTPTALCRPSMDQLVECGFLTVSPLFVAHVRAVADAQGTTATNSPASLATFRT